MGCSDSDLVDQIASSARAEAIACARRLSAIGELHSRRQILVEDDCGRELWSCDVWDAVAAEVAAAEGITPGAASEQLRYALALRDRLPRVGSLLAEGLIGFRVVRVVIARTALALDPDVLTRIDAELASQLRSWRPMSMARLEQAVDAIVVRFDPAARRRAASSSKSRHVDFDMSSQSGTAALWGVLYATDARALNRRLTEMASSLCSGDPRTMDQRRADALGALASGQLSLVCGCDDKDCKAAAERQVPSVIVHVVTESAEISDGSDLHGYDETYRELHSASEIAEEIRIAAERVPEQPLDPPAPNPPTIVGGSVIPASVLNELIRTGRAVVRGLRLPGIVQCRNRDIARRRLWPISFAAAI